MLATDHKLPRMELKIVLPDQDDELIDELRGTTETKTTSGHSIYHPAVRDQEHNTCLVANTMIETRNGLIPIQDIQVGDYVKTRGGYQRVLISGMTNPIADVYTAYFSNGSKLIGTFDHPVFIHGKGFIPLGELKYHDPVYTSDTEAVVLVVVPSGKEAVYNLTVENEPEFFANWILVHNCAARYACLAMLAAQPVDGQSDQIKELGWGGGNSNWKAPW